MSTICKLDFALVVVQKIVPQTRTARLSEQELAHVVVVQVTDLLNSFILFFA